MTNTIRILIQMPIQMPIQMQPLYPVILILILNRFLLDVFVNKSDIITFQMEEMGERMPADLHHQKVCRSKRAKHGTNSNLR